MHLGEHIRKFFLGDTAGPPSGDALPPAAPPRLSPAEELQKQIHAHIERYGISMLNGKPGCLRTHGQCQDWIFYEYQRLLSLQGHVQGRVK
jgi:hypothetical protein